MQNHFIFHNKIDIYKKCKCNHKNIHYSLTTTVFNMYTNNLIIILNRIENTKNFSLRMVKVAKKKGKYVEIAKVRNVETNVNIWTLQKCGDFLKENNVIRIRNLNDLKK